MHWKRSKMVIIYYYHNPKQENKVESQIINTGKQCQFLIFVVKDNLLKARVIMLGTYHQKNYDSFDISCLMKILWTN